MSYPQFNAAHELEGILLDGGWRVGPMTVRNPNSTGGMFSTSYSVTHTDGRQAFMKVVDLASAITNIDQLQGVINEYIYERDLLTMCGERRLDRVVTAIDHGQFHMPDYVLGSVNYIIFELASNDIRVALSTSDTFDILVRLELFHHLAVGINQLHKNLVAHQDLKPSNFLIFDGEGEAGRTGKVADLGRAYWEGHPSLHDVLTCPGDMGYAPFEQLYRFKHADENVRRFSADLYQLGNLAVFIFCGITMNALVSQRLAPEHHWSTWADGYPAVLPYVVDAFEMSLADIGPALPKETADQITRIIRYLCNPDADRRGHPRTLTANARRFSLERTITEIDLLAKRTATTIGRA